MTTTNPEARRRAEARADRIRCEVLAAKLLNEATQGAYDAEDVTQWADKIESHSKAFAAEQRAEAKAEGIREMREACQKAIENTVNRASYVSVGEMQLARVFIDAIKSVLLQQFAAPPK